MQNKGAVKLLAIALALVCLYQLSFTWFATKVENKAKVYAKDDLNKEQHYLDSISGEVVYNFLGLYKYTYRDCNERKLNLGLDLKGGMNVILEVNVADVISALSNFSNDSTFVKALALAKHNQITHPREDFVTLFGEAFEKVAPGAKLASIFSTVELKDRVSFDSSNEQVLKVLREEANAAIDNSFNILQNRIDKFGVVQPVIQQLETKGRIEVQLPGVREPERVRKLLQGTANLEFWTTYENSELFNGLIQANQKIKELKVAEKAAADSAANLKLAQAGKSAATKTGENTQKTDTGSVSLLKKIEKGAGKTTDSTSLKGQMNDNPLFSVLYPSYDQKTNQPLPGAAVGRALVRDTGKVNSYLNMKQIRSLFPRDVRFLWASKPEKEKSEILELYAIKVSTRDGRAPLDGSAIVNARGEYGANRSVAEVSMTMNGDGAKVWAKLTKENIGRCIAIVLDNNVQSAPRVNSEIPNGSSVITGNFTINEANDLAIVLKAGKMPAPARIVDENIVGPSLGKESIKAGMYSFIIAFIGVLLYMWLYYGRAGSVANIALFANVFFLFGVFASMGLVLTLPGFAGIVLTLAMAVDGNVIIYERMREEVRAGKGERMVVK
ncbi:MAG TPA: protein translocase subunit SecD, partial [Bacteroidales bacterium]